MLIDPEVLRVLPLVALDEVVEVVPVVAVVLDEVVEVVPVVAVVVEGGVTQDQVPELKINPALVQEQALATEVAAEFKMEPEGQGFTHFQT